MTARRVEDRAASPRHWMPARAEMPLPNAQPIQRRRPVLSWNRRPKFELRLSYNITNLIDFSDDKFAMLGGEPYSEHAIEESTTPLWIKIGTTNQFYLPPQWWSRRHVRARSASAGKSGCRRMSYVRNSPLNGLPSGRGSRLANEGVLYIATIFFISNGIGAFSIIDRVIYGQWEGKPPELISPDFKFTFHTFFSLYLLVGRPQSKSSPVQSIYSALGRDHSTDFGRLVCGSKRDCHARNGIFFRRAWRNWPCRNHRW